MIARESTIAIVLEFRCTGEYESRKAFAGSAHGLERNDKYLIYHPNGAGTVWQQDLLSLN